MKKYGLSFILLFLLVASFFNFSYIINVAGYDTLTYTFGYDEFYDSNDGLEYYSGFNVRNATKFTGNYSGTYSFENDEIGSVPDDWISNNGDGCDTTISSIVGGHSKILNISDNSAVNLAQINNEFTLQTNETVEFWVRPHNIASGNLGISLYEGATWVVRTRIAFGDRLSNHDASLIADIDDNTWYHIKYIFDDYNNQFEAVINGVSKGNFDYQFNTVVGFDKLRFDTVAAHNGVEYYIDAIGYSWNDNYTIGDNFVPLTTIENNVKEVDRYEFAFEGFQDQYEVGEDIFSNWTEIDDGDDQVNIATDPLYQNDRRIEMGHYAPLAQDLGIEKEFYVNSGVLNITWTANFSSWGTNSEYRCKVYSSDDTLISHIYLENGDLKYDAGTLDSGLTTNVRYEFNLYINYFNEISILNYYADDVHIDTYILPLIASGKDGLGKVELFIDVNIFDDVVVFLDYVGIYVNGSSISEEFAYQRIYNLVYDENWYLHQANLFRFNAIGNLSFYVSKYTYVPFISTIGQICLLDYYNGSNIFNTMNIDDFAFNYVYVPMLWIQFYNQIELFNVSISGIGIEESDNVYYVELTSSGVDNLTDYFYVEEGSNRLKYSLTANDDGLEYIQLRINLVGLPIVPDVLSENRSISYKSDIDGDLSGYMSVNYTDDTNTTLSFPTHATKTTVILPPTKAIDDLIILITDDNLDDSGFCSGYISDLKLIYYPDVSVSIITQNLLVLIVPLIILLVPSLAMHKKFGSTGTIIMFMLMNVICVISALIPSWLFFIIAVSSMGFLFMKKKVVKKT